jgi:predicted neuraminidase
VRPNAIFVIVRRHLLTVLCATSLTYAAVTQEFIYTEAPFPSAHASTIVELKNGDMLSAWFGGSAEGKPDVAIWGARRSNGKWSDPVELAREPDIACYNPVYFHSADGKLWLYYKFGPHPSSWTAGRRFSIDDGKTWSAIEHLPAGIYGPIRAKPLVLPNGIVVSGTSVESYKSWAVWIERSADNAQTWTRIGPIIAPASLTAAGTYGIIQPSVVRLKDGTLRLYARSTGQIAKICVSDSTDNGLHWTRVHTLDLPNPNSGLDAVALRDGRVVLIFNDTAKGRSPLNVAVSNDGEHFRVCRTLESDAAGEFSYPSMIQARNGDLCATYTWNRKRIRYARIPLAEIP